MMRSAACLRNTRLPLARSTGKERDAESGLDYFGARYYSSNMGLFSSPDWSNASDPIPYADTSDPQSLNLYAYASNNPLANLDLDGHEASFVCTPCRAVWNWLKNAFGGGGGGGGGGNGGLNYVTSMNILPTLSGMAKETVNTVNGLSNLVSKNGYQYPMFTINKTEKSGALIAGVGMFFLPGGEEANAVRELTAADLGIRGALISLDGTFSISGGVATVRINNIAGRVLNPLSIVHNLERVAKAAGATELRIEGTLANERLASILERRYGMTSSGATDVIVIPLH